MLDNMARMIERTDPQFRNAMDLDELLEGNEPLAKYFESVSQDTGKEIRAVRLTLNNWAEKLGIGLISVTFQPLATRDFRRLGKIKPFRMLPESEHKFPTVGIIPNIPDKDQVNVGFKISEGAEELTALSYALFVKEFQEGDLLQYNAPLFAATQSGGNILINEGSLVGISVNVTDEGKLAYSGIEHGKLYGSGEIPNQAYLCRCLTNEAASKILENSR